MPPVARVRLLIDATPLAATRLTGVARVLLATLRALDDDAFAARADVVLLVPRDEVAAVRRFGFTRLRVRSIPMPHQAWSLLSRTPVPIDLLLGRGVYFFPNFRNWALSRSSGITFVHDACYAVYPNLVPMARRRFLQANVGRWLRRSDLVATGTPSAAAELESPIGVARERIRVLPTTVDAALFRPTSDSAVAAVRERHRLGRYLLFLGSIEPRKNIAALVRAYAAADRPDGHTLLLVGGDGWDNDDVSAAIAAARAAGADVRRPESYVTDAELPALLTGADALVLTSWHEGFGLPVLEALACGTRVIAADIPGIRDSAAGHESDVDFVDPADDSSITAAISRRIADPSRCSPAVPRPWSDAAEALVAAAESLPRR
ncbi:glycosyltransferase family 4 protein [Microbacteriaceae bacterium VKM Ac-2854]|nr:glycosyltransferase family 4 protein [Microbacteriaceae bacterium VKM Ac-2854]